MRTEFTPVEHTIEGVYVGHADKIDRKVNDMNKRLARLGAPAASVEFGPRVERSEKDPLTGWTRHWEEFEYVTVTGSAAKIAGWTPIASLDHTFVTDDGDSEAWISMFPAAVENEVELPAEFRTVGRGCDHCGTNRKRKTTVVFRSDDGEWINVGTSCLRDFIGLTPATILWLNESFNSFHDDDEFDVPREAYEPGIHEVLMIAAAITDSSGFVPSRGDNATKWDVFSTLAKGHLPKYRGRYLNDEWNSIDWDAAKAKADAVIDWVLDEAAKSDSDYIYNASLAVRANRVPDRAMGLVVSLPHVFNKATARAAEAEAKAAARPEANDEHVGEVGDKLVLRPVTIVKAIKVDTMYGTSVRVTGIDADGHKVTTFGSGDSLFRVDVDDVVEWRGTVKALNDSDEYGVETEFNRVKLLDLPSDVDFTKVAKPGDRIKVTVAGDHASHELRFPREVPDGWVFDANNDDGPGTLYATVTKVGKRDDRFAYTTNAPVGIFAGADIEVLDDDAEFPAWRMTDIDVKRDLRYNGICPDRADEVHNFRVRMVTKWAEERGVEVTDELIEETIARFEALTAEEVLA